MRYLLLAFFAALTLLGAPVLRAADSVLKVSYSGKILSFTLAELAALPHQEITLMDPHEKKSHAYSGVPVRDLLAQAGAPLGDQLRGPALRLAVLVRSRDNYEVMYALAEFDLAFSDRTILLVDGRDGQPLGSGEGPVRFVVPGDKRPARWAKMIESIEVLVVRDDPPRLGAKP